MCIHGLPWLVQSLLLRDINILGVKWLFCADIRVIIRDKIMSKVIR